MRARTELRHQLRAAIDAYASDMVELFLAETLRAGPLAGSPRRIARRPRRAIVRFDERDLPANTNASSFVDGFHQLAHSATLPAADPAFLLTLALLGLVTNARFAEGSSRSSIRRRGALRSVP